jgi:thioredoxin 1
MMPIVHKLKKELENEVLILQFDIDENQELSQSLNVETIPAFLLYRHGKEVWRHSGEIEFTNLLNSIEVY